ncbi:hypothetical protein J3L18_31035 [Mucilaginibacter gossypii]|uniref:hypothetical protein n=1 Tax=Mucilaginibacter gossypii TaxID=551996 RepID=UPI000DCE59A7|nr:MULTISPECIES: hypothetical protein [Mucilaginibacter]QTE37482.1 hypothetical protein J3L18_31035 [Mucilaginibacter gossypii]RAV52309.1 hypothetical protein DIU36_24555 [Mucilaginibacter rubeus]
MRKLDTSPISTTNAMPVKAGTLEHIQFAYQEAIGELGKSLFGNYYDPTKVYILNGLVNSGSGSSYNISAGSVFYNGEIFLVDAAVFSISGSNVARGIIVTSFYSGQQADGVEFTDGITRNVHQIRKVVMGAGLAGSGIGDYNNMVDLKYRPQGGIGQFIEWMMPPINGVSNQNTLLPSYFDTTTGEGIHPLTIGWNIDPDGGLFIVGFKKDDPDFGSIGGTGGSNEVTLTAGQIPEFGLTIQTVNYADIGGAGIRVVGNAGTSPGNDLNLTINVGGGGSHENKPEYKVRLRIYRTF